MKIRYNDREIEARIGMRVRVTIERVDENYASNGVISSIVKRTIAGECFDFAYVDIYEKRGMASYPVIAASPDELELTDDLQIAVLDALDKF